MKPKAVISWSGGKDCYLAFHRVKEQFEVVGLVTMMTEDGQRSRSHGLRPELLQAQARILGIPHWTESATWADYESAFGRLLARARAQGASHAIFGDIYPEANRVWAETISVAQGLAAIEPLCGEPTEELVREFLETQSRAILTTVRDSYLDQSYLGQELTLELVGDFIARGIDPCGERGEFHTFVTKFAGYKGSIPVVMGRMHETGGCSSVDLMLADMGAGD